MRNISLSQVGFKKNGIANLIFTFNTRTVRIVMLKLLNEKKNPEII